jgi:hypothetical protein
VCIATDIKYEEIAELICNGFAQMADEFRDEAPRRASRDPDRACLSKKDHR